MQHELAVRMFNRTRQITNQTYAIRHGRRVRVSIRQERQTPHQLQHDIRLIVGDAGIEQACDVRVIEPRQHGAFASEAGGELVGG